MPGCCDRISLDAISADSRTLRSGAYFMQLSGMVDWMPGRCDPVRILCGGRCVPYLSCDPVHIIQWIRKMYTKYIDAVFR